MGWQRVHPVPAPFHQRSQQMVKSLDKIIESANLCKRELRTKDVRIDGERVASAATWRQVCEIIAARVPRNRDVIESVEGLTDFRVVTREKKQA
jgi:hypothetical protein